MENKGYVKPVTLPTNALDHEQMDYIMKHGIKRITILRRGIEELVKEIKNEDSIKK